MNQEEKIIASLYTGIVFTDFTTIQQRAEQLLDRPIWTHEFAEQGVWNQLREKIKPEFLKMITSDTQ